MKKKFIACIIGCAMLLMGTGYAYWTDQFTLKATVDTGNFKVALTAAEAGQRFTDYTDERGRNDLTPEYSSSSGAVLTSIDSTSGSNIVEFELRNMYPGYGQEFIFVADNLGTVAAKLSSIDVNHEGWSADLEQIIGINLEAKIRNVSYTWLGDRWVESRSIDPWIANKPSLLEMKFGFYDFAIDDIPFVTIQNMRTINTNSDEFLLLDTKLNTTPKLGDSEYTHHVEILVRIAMDPDSDGKITSGKTTNSNYQGNGADVKTENQRGVLTLTFNWDQYNAQ